MDDLFAGNVTEIDMFELDDTMRRFQLNIAALVFTFRIQNIKNSFRSCQRCLDLSVKLSEFIDRTGKLFGINDKRRNHTY